MAKNAENESPLMKQHAEMKRKFPDAMLLFRVGDFYEWRAFRITHWSSTFRDW